MKNMNANLESIYNYDLIKINYINSLKSSSILGERDMLLITNAAYRPGLDTFKASVAATKTNEDEIITNYKAILTNDLEKEQFSEFEKLLENSRETSDKIIQLVDSRNYTDAGELMTEYGEGILTDKLAFLDKQLELVTENAKIYYNNSQSAYKSASIQSIVITIWGLVITAVLGIIISTTISTQIKKIIMVAKSIGENDLAKTVDIDNNSET